MRLNHADPVLSYEGKPVPQDNDELGPVTFRTLVMLAFGNLPFDAGSEKKARVFSLSTKFYKGKFVNLTVDEAALIKEMAGIGLSAWSYGRVCEWLEGEPQVIAEDDDDDESYLTPPEGVMVEIHSDGAVVAKHDPGA